MMNDIKTNRNQGLDLLRVLSMLSVVTLHILGHGGIMDSDALSNTNAIFAWLIEIIAYPAVNCFVLITGFCGFRNGNYFPNFKNLVKLYINVIFYTVLIPSCIWIFSANPITPIDFICSFFPVTTQQYWFFTCYFAMMILSPLYNAFVDKASPKVLGYTCFVIFIFLSAYSTVATRLSDPFSVNNGFSVAWLSTMYIIGAVIKKHNIIRILSTKTVITVMAVAYAVAFGTKVGFLFFNEAVAGIPISKLGNLFLCYPSPTFLLTSIGFLVLFARMEVSSTWQKIVAFFVPTSFSVYLIHNNTYFSRYYFSGAFTFLSQKNPLVMVISVLVAGIGVFVGLSLVDRIRMLIFKLLHVDWLSERIEAVCKKGVMLSKKAVQHVFLEKNSANTPKGN